MLISVDLVSVLAENLTSLQDIDEFSSLAQRFLVMITSGIYDQEHQTNFAEAAMEKLRIVKPIGQKKQYIVGQPQDVCEMTEFVIFPLLLGACIEFVTNIHLHQTDSEPHLETRLSFLCEADGAKEFVFASPITLSGTLNIKNGTFVDSTDFASIKEVLIATSPLSTPDKSETRFMYRLVSFISYLGHTELGHYITYTYVNDLDSSVYAVFDGISLSSRTKTQFVESARKTSQLLFYKLVSQETFKKSPVDRKKRTKQATKPDSPFVDLSDAPDN